MQYIRIIFLSVIFFILGNSAAYAHRSTVKQDDYSECRDFDKRTDKTGEKLNLRNCWLHDETMNLVHHYILNHPKVSTIVLDNYNYLSSSSIINLTKFENITSFIFINQKFDTAILSALANDKYLRNLTVRSSSNMLNGVNDDDAIILSKNKEIKNLELDYQDIRDDGAIAISSMDSLETLNLAHNGVGKVGAIAIAGMKNLKELVLFDNEIGDEGFAAFANNKTIKELVVGINNIHDEGVEIFALNNQSVEVLSLRGNPVGDQGAISLAKNKTLKSLFLSWNRTVSGPGASALAQNTTLEYLSLQADKIGNEGAIALSKNTTLKGLNVEWNGIGCEGLTALKANKLFPIAMDHNAICPDP